MPRLQPKRRRWLRPALAGIGVLLLLIAVVAVALWVRDNTGNDLEARAAEALRAEGIAVEEITVDGDDVRLVVAGDEADGDRAAQIVSALSGVGEVEWSLAAPGETSTTTLAGASPPTTASPPATDTTESPPATTAPTTTSPTTTTAVAPAEEPRLVARLRDGRIRLEGVIPDPGALAALTQTTDLIYGPFVELDVELDNSVPSAAWVSAAPRAVSVLPIIGDGTLELAGDTARLTGRAFDEAKVAQIEGALGAILGSDIDVESDVEITGLEPPTFEAEARPDGTLVLRGVMPDDEVLALINDAAAAAYGAENVTNEMVVGENTGRNFSVFRIPLTFSLFRQIPQWNLAIVDDAISGNLRGGATYPVGSAEVTPELEALLQVAAGILLRNPTLAMVIEGHTDSTGSDELNQRLSEARAENAAAFLVGLGIDPARLEAVGFGETRPIADNNTAAGRAQNRRVEFRLKPTGGQ